MNVAVVDDEREISEQLRERVQSLLRKRGEGGRVAVFPDGTGAAEALERGEQFQIWLLDIEMPGVNGMELAAQIRQKDRKAYLIFITSHVEYAVEGYELGVYRFIPKTLLSEKLAPALWDAMEELKGEEEHYYVIRNSLRCEKIPLSSVLYLYKDGKNVVFVTAEGSSSDRTTIGEVAEALREEGFITIDRGYMVNARHVMKVQNKEVFLRDGTVLYISRSNVQHVKAEIAALWKR